MAKARYCRTHPWAGVRYDSQNFGKDGQRAFWRRLTLGFVTVEFLPTKPANQVQQIIDYLWGGNDPKAGDL